MKLTTTREIKDNKFTSVIAFAEWGGTDITAEDEKELLENYPCLLQYNDIKFSGRFKLDEKNNVVLIKETKEKKPVVENIQKTENKLVSAELSGHDDSHVEEHKELQDEELLKKKEGHMEAPQMGKAHIEVSDEHGTKETHTMEIEDTSKQVDYVDNDGDFIELSIINKITPLDEKFQVKYEINTTEVLNNEIGKHLINKELVCQAKTILFEEKIMDKIRELIKGAKAKNNDFEKVSPIETTI